MSSRFAVLCFCLFAAVAVAAPVRHGHDGDRRSPPSAFNATLVNECAQALGSSDAAVAFRACLANVTANNRAGFEVCLRSLRNTTVLPTFAACIGLPTNGGGAAINATLVNECAQALNSSTEVDAFRVCLANITITSKPALRECVSLLVNSTALPTFVACAQLPVHNGGDSDSDSDRDSGDSEPHPTRPLPTTGAPRTTRAPTTAALPRTQQRDNDKGGKH